VRARERAGKRKAPMLAKEPISEKVTDRSAKERRLNKKREERSSE